MLVPHTLPLPALALALLSCASIAPTPATAQRLKNADNTHWSGQPNTVALTFDDGPYIYEQELINKLNDASVKSYHIMDQRDQSLMGYEVLLVNATFFVYAPLRPSPPVHSTHYPTHHPRHTTGNGLNYGCIYDQPNVDSLKYAYVAGHEFGSHTWAHRDLGSSLLPSSSRVLVLILVHMPLNEQIHSLAHSTQRTIHDPQSTICTLQHCVFVSVAS
ncbi:hypothetical protein K439DRAFT_1617731 [Ramaria rubella]|nr:hypothetical protein K439DRAFT_1617731 [Ramaria rubella]